LLELAQERSLDGVLRKAIDAAAAVPGVALARVYLLAPGDICPTCPQESVCPDQTQCLHAAVSGGPLLHGEGGGLTAVGFRALGIWGSRFR
jgi:hypothetical protein